MTVLEQTTPRVIAGRAIDILDAPPAQGISRGFARIDPGDPVFFDHPLDHVPGMLLVVAALELANHAGMLSPRDVTFRLTFTKFCELHDAVEVRAFRQSGQRDGIEVLQSGRNIASGTVWPRETRQPRHLAVTPDLRQGTIPAELVHRADSSNIAIGPLTVANGRVWTRVREQKGMAELPGPVNAISAVVEAARQLTIAILHLWGKHLFGTKMILIGLTAEVPTTVPEGPNTLALSWEITPADKTTKISIDVYALDDHQTKIGSVLLATRCADEHEYARLRAR